MSIHNMGHFKYQDALVHLQSDMTDQISFPYGFSRTELLDTELMMKEHMVLWFQGVTWPSPG